MAELEQRITTVSRAASAAWRAVVNLCLLADASCEVGAVDTGFRALDAIPSEHREIIFAPEIQRIQGELLLRRDDPERAEECFRKAVAIARHRSERSLELRAATSLARLLPVQGRRELARRELHDVYAWFTEGFETSDLRAARALLDELGGANA